MNKVQVITDSASDIRGEFAKKLDVAVVPLIIRFGDDILRDEKDISVGEFYKRLAEEEELPQTSAPSPGDFEAEFQKAADQGAEAVLSINISSKLSATMQSAEIAAKNMAKKIPNKVIDSCSVTAGQGLLVIKAAELAKEGKNLDEICEEVENAKRRLSCFGVLNTLENLKRGGRIGKARAFFGAALNYKPALDLSSGEVEAAGKVRTRRKSLEWLCNKVASAGELEALAVGHGAAEDFPDFLDKLSQITDSSTMYTGDIGAVIGTHAGAGVVGLAYIRKTE